MRKSTKSTALVDGNHLLYRLFAHLLDEKDEVAQQIAMKMIIEMSIWLPLELYRECPVMLPWAVRNPNCRKHTKDGIKYPENWGAPNENGYQMDDNTLIKGIPRSLKVTGNNRGSQLIGKRIGKSFVASHIWREIENDENLASRIPELNSFVPNLVWLPTQISKLSDIEDGIIQDMLKHATWEIYRDAPVNPNYQEHTEAIWRKLEPDIGKFKSFMKFNPKNLLFFESNEKFIEKRIKITKNALRFIEICCNGCSAPKPKMTGRYAKGLPEISKANLEKLLTEVGKYVK
jgi:hypothetical protein